MTAPFANKEWIETKEEITNWFILNDFEHIIQKYDNKETGWLWWKKRYSDYYTDNNSPEYFINIEKDIAKYNELSWWQKPFVSFFSRINTKQKLLHYYYAKELLKKTISQYHSNSVPNVSKEIDSLINKVKNNSFVKGIGKHLNKFATSIFSFMSRSFNSIKREDTAKNEPIKPEISPNDILTPALQKTLNNKISEMLGKIERSDLQRWLSTLGTIEHWTLNDAEVNNLWKLFPLLKSDNNYIKQITLFFILLHALKPALLNYEEIINNALNQSPFTHLSINWNALDSRYSNYQKSLFEKLLNHYPGNILLLMVKIKCDGDIHIRASSDGWSRFKINVIYPKEFTSLVQCQAYESVLISILKNLPTNVTHLNLSEALLANVQDLPSIFKNIPLTVQTIDICDKQLLKHNDDYLNRAFSALPKHLLSIKIIDKTMSEDDNGRLDNLSTDLKKTVSQNISLKNLAVDFISRYMKGSYDDENKKLNYRHKNENKSVSVPQDIGDIFIKKQQLGLKH